MMPVAETLDKNTLPPEVMIANTEHDMLAAVRAWLLTREHWLYTTRVREEAGRLVAEIDRVLR